MAKQQSFADKLKKKKKSDIISVKVIKGVNTEKGTVGFIEKFVNVKDLSELDKIDIN